MGRQLHMPNETETPCAASCNMIGRGLRSLPGMRGASSWDHRSRRDGLLLWLPAGSGGAVSAAVCGARGPPPGQRP